MQDAAQPGLDPDDWDSIRTHGHRMLDDMFDYLEHLRERPVWQSPPDNVRARYAEPLPREGCELGQAHERFMHEILPYAVGNAHPGFMGWVHGGGTPVGMLAEMLAAGLNANLGGRNQMPVEVERQIVRWMRELFAFPATASGLFVTGTSLANLIALLVARTAALGASVRQKGVGLGEGRLTAYASTDAHGCIRQAMDLAGFGAEALREIPVDAGRRMDTAALESTLAADRKAGFRPFFIAGTAGTVDTGAIDDLAGVAAIAEREGAWFHVDGAFGALGMLTPELAPLLAGIERADSIAFDFHKWLQVPYDAGFVLVRDGERHRETFCRAEAYLNREERGLAADSPWPCDFGPDLSRGFRALKTWFTLQVYGTDRLGRTIAGTCALARYLGDCVSAEPRLELLAPVSLNIVCFRYRAQEPDRLNRDIVAALQESGVAAPSTTVLDGRLAIRCAILNHRTGRRDIDAMFEAVLAQGAALETQSIQDETS
ncbi:MAG: aspartate aminotransferase family protein [Acidihalobacter sp.]